MDPRSRYLEVGLLGLGPSWTKLDQVSTSVEMIAFPAYCF